MKITIIILTILYLILTVVANYIDKYMYQIGQALSTKKFVKLGIIRNICELISFIVFIIDIAFISVFILQ